jgi:hypothetical protein
MDLLGTRANTRIGSGPAFLLLRCWTVIVPGEEVRCRVRLFIVRVRRDFLAQIEVHSHKGFCAGKADPFGVASHKGDDTFGVRRQAPKGRPRRFRQRLSAHSRTGGPPSKAACSSRRAGTRRRTPKASRFPRVCHKPAPKARRGTRTRRSIPKTARFESPFTSARNSGRPRHYLAIRIMLDKCEA